MKELEKITTSDPLGHAIANPDEGDEETDLEVVAARFFELDPLDSNSNLQPESIFMGRKAYFAGRKLHNSN